MLSAVSVRRCGRANSDAIKAADNPPGSASNLAAMPLLPASEVPEREIFPGFIGRVTHSAAMTFVRWRITAGATLPVHSHPHEQVVHMLDGKFELTIDGITRVLEPGDVAVIPSNAVHAGRAVTECRILDAFHPIREDYR
jgi:quercetin dioxygenase-like cupin family protein